MSSLEQNWENKVETPPSVTSSGQETIPLPKVDVEAEFIEFVPEEFLSDPSGYFEREGKNVKTGEIKIDADGTVRQDPTAVKDLPVWVSKSGQELLTVGKRINTAKGKVGESGDPFYEYNILRRLREMDLPAARPIAKAEQGSVRIMLMEHIPGIRWSEGEALQLKAQGYSDDDIENLKAEARKKMEELRERFEKAGVVRGWKLKDMVVQIGEDKRITAVIPTDWERTKIIERAEDQS